MIDNKVKLAVTYFDRITRRQDFLLWPFNRCLCRFLNLFERSMSDDSLDFTVPFILPLSESLKWNKSFFTFICWISPAWSRVSQLPAIYPAVWLSFCRGLPLTDSERASRKSILFLCSISLVRFLSTLYLWPILFTLEWKTNSHLFFLLNTTKNLKRTGVIDPCCYCHWPLFSHFLHSLLFHFCKFLKAQG